jgi:hypothetical protein
VTPFRKILTLLVAAAALEAGLLTGLPTALRADQHAGSIYSRYGLGEISWFDNSRSVGMGSAGLALLSQATIDRFNPALWSDINRTRFTATGMYEGYSMSDAQSSVFLSTLRFSGAMIAIPLYTPGGVTLAGGFVPYSRVNYNIITNQHIGSTSFVQQYIGSGGVSLAHLGLSFSPFRDLAIGSKVDYRFGTIERTAIQSFSVAAYASSQEIHSLHVSGVGATVGTVFSGLTPLLGLPPRTSLNIGGYFASQAHATTTEEIRENLDIGYTVARDTTEFPDGTMIIPSSLGAGIAYQSDRLSIAADAIVQPGSQFSINSVNSPSLRDGYRLAGGIELVPKGDLQSPFAQRSAFRFGGFYNATYLDINGQPINEKGITAGFGTPIFQDTRLDMSFEYSWRGTTDYNLQEEKIFRMTFSLTIGELWFVRPEEE